MKLWFENFSHHWMKNTNFIVDILRKKTNIKITSDNPDLVIFSNFGDIEKIKNYECKKCFYTMENIKYVTHKKINNAEQLILNFPFEYYLKHSDFSLLFHKQTNTNIEFPVWVALLPNQNFDILTEKRKPFLKDKYCSFIVSNNLINDNVDLFKTISPRYYFFKKLSEKKYIHSGGKYKNNIGYPVKNKCEYLKKFVFNLAFENSYEYHYTTEKLIDPFISSCIPIYWGGERCFDFFRKDLVLNANNKSVDEVFNEMEEIYNDKDKIKYMTTEPVIDKYPIEYTPNYIAEQILDKTFCTI